MGVCAYCRKTVRVWYTNGGYVPLSHKNEAGQYCRGSSMKAVGK